MKLKSLILVLVLVAIIGGIVYAQNIQPQANSWRFQQEELSEFGPGYGPCHGSGRMHHRRMMGGWGR